MGLVQTENVTGWAGGGGGHLLPRCICEVSVLHAQVNTLENSKRQVAEGDSSVCSWEPQPPAARWQLSEEGRGAAPGLGLRPGGPG